MNTKNNLLNISKFKLEDRSKSHLMKTPLQNKKKNSYAALKQYKENYNSFSLDKTALKEKENQKPFLKEKKPLILNKSFDEFPLKNPSKNQINSFNKQKTHVKSKSFLLPKESTDIFYKEKGFKLFGKKQKNEGFLSFEEDSHLKDITNTQNNAEFEKKSEENYQEYYEENNEINHKENYDEENHKENHEGNHKENHEGNHKENREGNHEENYDEDPNVMTMKELKSENEEELKNLMDSIEEKMLFVGKNKEVLSEMEQKKTELSQKYQELIKKHSNSLQEIQGKINKYQEKNKDLIE